MGCDHARHPLYQVAGPGWRSGGRKLRLLCTTTLRAAELRACISPTVPFPKEPSARAPPLILARLAVEKRCSIQGRPEAGLSGHVPHPCCCTPSNARSAATQNLSMRRESARNSMALRRSNLSTARSTVETERRAAHRRPGVSTGATYLQPLSIPCAARARTVDGRAAIIGSPGAHRLGDWVEGAAGPPDRAHSASECAEQLVARERALKARR